MNSAVSILLRLTVPGMAAIVLCNACTEAIVPQAELVGTWTVASESRELLSRKVRTGSIALTLRNDGTFEAVDVPGDLLGEGREWQDRFVDGAGNWFRDEAFGDQRIGLKFQTVAQPYNFKLPFQAVLWASTTRQGPRLYYYRGDPDERVMVVFEKVHR
jgi:hypothetical protein